MDIVNWFNPYDKEHVAAYFVLTEKGQWPENFIPDWVELSPTWYMEITASMADAWVKHILEEK